MVFRCFAVLWKILHAAFPTFILFPSRWCPVLFCFAFFSWWRGYIVRHTLFFSKPPISDACIEYRLPIRQLLATPFENQLLATPFENRVVKEVVGVMRGASRWDNDVFACYSCGAKTQHLLETCCEYTSTISLLFVVGSSNRQKP